MPGTSRADVQAGVLVDLLVDLWRGSSAGRGRERFVVSSAREVWRCLSTWEAEPGFNMALDESLLSAREAPPTLRFYTWRPEALSLGYFQRYSDVAALRRVDCVVRRLTGGGAIHHAQELTFSIAADLDHPLYRGEVRASYERVHALLARALAIHGVRAELRGPRTVTSDDEASGMCFHRSTDIDLVWGGAKGVGSAQRRSGGRVLHHGSIKIGSSPHEAGVATVSSTQRPTSPAELADTIRSVFEDLLAIGLEDSEPSPAEQAWSSERAPFFRSAEHVRRR